jgi:hypothetical protein
MVTTLDRLCRTRTTDRGDNVGVVGVVGVAVTVARMAILMSATKKDTAASCIDFQSDESMYGRGEYHLSAAVEEGDVVVYQTGTWLVDGVPVGDGSPADWKLARLETIQIIWTHNCEHGVLRGIAVKVLDDDDGSGRCRNTVGYDYDGDDGGEQIMTMVEFGPEQLVARLPIIWDDSVDQGVVVSEEKMVLDPSLWRQEIDDGSAL